MRFTVEPFPPGEYIQDEMAARGWTEDRMAESLGISRQHLSELYAGKVPLTQSLAKAIAQVFGTSALVWLNLQWSYERSLEAQRFLKQERTP